MANCWPAKYGAGNCIIGLKIVILMWALTIFNSKNCSTQLNISFKPASNSRAIRKAVSREGEYRPCSIAANVCNVTPLN